MNKKAKNKASLGDDDVFSLKNADLEVSLASYHRKWEETECINLKA